MKGASLKDKLSITESILSSCNCFGFFFVTALLFCSYGKGCACTAEYENSGKHQFSFKYRFSLLASTLWHPCHAKEDDSMIDCVITSGIAG